MANDYVEALKNSMNMLATDPKVLFIGQTVAYGGSRYTTSTLNDVPLDRRLELPIAENMQMGMSLGLALGGYIPVSIYPRVDFLPLALDQLVNHLDKVEEMSDGRFKPKVIIRAIVGGTQPIDPGPQHRQDHFDSIKAMLTNIDAIKLERADQIIPAYQRALNSDRSSLIVELGDLHHKYPQ